jgi:hypothetical protein
MWLIQRFCSQIGLRSLLQRHVPITQRNGRYHPAEMILVLMYGIIMGLQRINKTEILQYNGAFLEMLGLTRFPDQTTLRRFLKRLTPAEIRRLVRLHDSLRAHFMDIPKRQNSLVFDIDSVVIVIYGKPEKAAKGYNPKKRGRRSYHPLFCFEAHLQEFWHGTLRPGNAASSTGIIPFLKVCLAKAPEKIGRSRIRFRMDAGFYSKEVIEFIEGKGCGYVIVAKMHSRLCKAMYRAKYHKMSNGWAIGEFTYQPLHWKKPHRFIAVRRPIPDDAQEAKEMTLFKDRKHAYHVFVTNLGMTPWRVYLFYNGRAAVEKDNRELLYDYPLGKIPTHNWTANVAFFQTVLFAANIAHWFKRLCLPEEYQNATLDTIRTDFLVLPAKLVHSQGKNIIKLPHDYHHREAFLDSVRKINQIYVPKKLRFCS